MCATAIRTARHPQRAADLDRADRHDLPLCRQRLFGDRAGVRLCLHPQGAAEGRHAAPRKRWSITPCGCGAKSMGDAPLPDYFVNAQTLPPLDHVRMQAAAQKWIDSSISKTINCPEDISFDDFKEVYMAAWDQGCKGCTTYRPNDVTGSVLTVSRNRDKPRPKRPQAVRQAGPRWSICPNRWTARRAGRADLQGQMAGQRTRALHHHQRHRHRRPPPPVRGVHQLQEHGAFRLDRGADPDDLGGVPARRRYLLRGRGTEGGVRPARRRLDGGRYIPSILAAIGGVIERHLIAIGFIEGEGLGLKSDPKAEVVVVAQHRAARPARPAGAMTCGWSKAA